MRPSVHPVTRAAALAAILFLVGCGGRSPSNGGEMPAQDIKTVMEAHVGELMAIEGVTAVAIGALDDGAPCIYVYVAEKTDRLVARIPRQLGGYPVQVEESGVIRPMPDGGR